MPIPKWEAAPEVEKIAIQCIGDHHSHLVEANIKYLFRRGKWSSQDRETWGKAYKASDRDKFLSGYDFILAINITVWSQLKGDQRIALVDHELSHCSRGDDDKAGNPMWYIRGHDLEDFVPVVRRYGPWNEDARRYLAAAEKKEIQESEPTLFDPNQYTANDGQEPGQEQPFGIPPFMGEVGQDEVTPSAAAGEEETPPFCITEEDQAGDAGQEEDHGPDLEQDQDVEGAGYQEEQRDQVAFF